MDKTENEHAKFHTNERRICYGGNIVPTRLDAGDDRAAAAAAVDEFFDELLDELMDRPDGEWYGALRARTTLGSFASP